MIRQVFQLIHVLFMVIQQISHVEISSDRLFKGLMPWFLTPFALCSSTSVL